MKLRRLSSLLIFITAGLVYAAEYFNLNWIKLTVIIGLGLLAGINGVRLVMQGEAFQGRIRPGNPASTQKYADISARLFGAILVTSSLMIVGLCLLELFIPGGASAFLDRLVGSTFGLASIIALAGILLAAFGVIRILSGSVINPAAHSRLIEFKMIAGGVITALAGLGLLLLAIGSAFSPSLLQKVFGWILSALQ